MSLQHINSRIERDWLFCQQVGISRETLHSLHMQLLGVNVETHIKQNETAAYKEIHLSLPVGLSRSFTAVPRKIPIVGREDSPYKYENKRVLFYDDELVFGEKEVIQIPLPEVETPRYLKGYSFPFLGTSDPYYELRLNPKNTGNCPGRCKFCHRGFSYRMQPSRTDKLIPPDQIINAILLNYGEEALEAISHISVITELFGDENAFLDYLEETKAAFLKKRTNQQFSFRACAQDVRTKEGLARLFSIVDDKRYSYTLEVFSNRKRILGAYKGIDLEIVERILHNAHEVGFEDIKLNYVAGIDSISAFEEGFCRLSDKGLIDMVGLSIMTAFFPDQKSLRDPDANSIRYYKKLIDLLGELNIAIYEPSCFEMGYPMQLLENVRIYGQ